MTSARVNPNTRSAAGLNSRTRPVASIVMMQSSAESRKVRLRASSVVAGLLTLFRWSCSDDIGATGHGFINCYEATWNAERLTDLTCGRQSFSHKTKVSYCLPSGSNLAVSEVVAAPELVMLSFTLSI